MDVHQFTIPAGIVFTYMATFAKLDQPVGRVTQKFSPLTTPFTASRAISDIWSKSYRNDQVIRDQLLREQRLLETDLPLLESPHQAFPGVITVDNNGMMEFSVDLSAITVHHKRVYEQIWEYVQKRGLLM